MTKEERKEYRLKNKDKIAKQMKQYRLEHKGEIAEKNRQYRLKNKEKVAEIERQYRIKHKDKITEQQKQYYIKNKDKIAEQKKRYWRDHKDKIAEQQKQYYLEHKDEIAEYSKQLYYTKYVCRLGSYFRRNYSRFITLENFISISKNPNESLKRSVMIKLGRGSIDQNEAVEIAGVLLTDKDHELIQDALKRIKKIN